MLISLPGTVGGEFINKTVRITITQSRIEIPGKVLRLDVIIVEIVDYLNSGQITYF